MLRILLFFLLVIALASCSGLKPLSSSNSVNNSDNAVVSRSINTPDKKTDKQIRFLDDISVSPQSTEAKNANLPANKIQATTMPAVSIVEAPSNGEETSIYSSGKAAELQTKYSALLNIDPEMLDNTSLLNLVAQVDEWYGTRYLYGGMGKSGIDCSAFTQAIYLATFGMSIPRTAAEQFRVSRIISATDLKEGDLLFFNTTGGISHVGLYLANNKFVHASSSGGVKISDMFESYYIRRYLGAGRIDKPQAKN